MRLVSVAFVAVFTIIVGLGSAHAACTNASLVGSYGAILYQGNGYAIHLFHYAADGNGNLNGSDTRSVGGTIETQTFTGSYSVSKNCAGSFTLTFPDGSTGTYSFVIDHGKKGFEIMETDSGYNTGGSALTQGTVPCGLTGKPQIVAVNLAGVGGVHKVTSVGQLNLSGTGTISGGRVTISIDGTIGTYPATGTYTVNADCTGTVQVTLKGLSTSNFALVSVNGGQEFLMLETDTSTMFSGIVVQ